MKFRNLFMTAIFFVAVVTSFALKARGSHFIVNATYIPTYQNYACYEGPVDNNCSTFNTGPQCTVYDASNPGVYVPAFEKNPNASLDCTRPLRRKF